MTTGPPAKFAQESIRYALKFFATAVPYPKKTWAREVVQCLLTVNYAKLENKSTEGRSTEHKSLDVELSIQFTEEIAPDQPITLSLHKAQQYLS